MKRLVPLKVLVIGVAACSAGSLMARADERPRPENYRSAYLYLQALEVWDKAHPDGGPPPANPSEIVLRVPASMDPTSELAPPPFDITGPEDLDHAVQLAKHLEHPAYKQKIRYHRTTHISFPLPKIDGEDMSEASVDGTLPLSGSNDKAKKAALEHLTSQLDQDQRRQQGQPDGPVAADPAAPAIPMVMDLPASGPREQVNVSVAGH
jgi:hypothetical protein